MNAKRRSTTIRHVALMVCGAGALVGFWFLMAALIGVNGGVPSPISVLRWWFDDRSIVFSNAATTASEACRGFLFGVVLAFVAAIVGHLVRPLQRTLMSIAVMSYCLPLVAIAPLLEVTLNGEAPEVTLAALCVFFTTMIGVSTGLRQASSTTLDVVRSLGGQSWAELRFVRMQSAIGPALAALSLAAPLAVLGAILGEFIGGNSGLGVALVNAQKTGDPVRAWAYCLTSLVIAGSATLVIAGSARVFVPWHRRSGAV